MKEHFHTPIVYGLHTGHTRFSTLKLRTFCLFIGSQFCIWISCWTGSVPFTLAAHYRPRSRVRASRTYVVAPYGRMLCAMLASWHCPRVNGQTLVNPTHSFSWDREAHGFYGDRWLVAAAWQWKEREGSQVTESNKSDRSQRWSEFGFWCTVRRKTAMVLKRWPVTYWSALTDRKWCCKSRHNHDEWPTI